MLTKRKRSKAKWDECGKKKKKKKEKEKTMKGKKKIKTAWNQPFY